MSVLAIRKYGDTVLRQKCAPVKDITPEIRQLVADMLETMYAAPGAGLAAPQVGIPLRICVIDVRPNGKPAPFVLINPKIVDQKGKMDDEEGCLSFPGLMASVKRYEQVRVEAVNEKGFPVVIEGRDMLCRALQHEIDHLDGKLFIDRLNFLGRKKIEREVKKRKKQGEW